MAAGSLKVRSDGEQVLLYLLRNDCEINDFPFALSLLCVCQAGGGNFTYFMKGYLRREYNYKMPCAHHTYIYREGKTGAASASTMPLRIYMC
jgi:hypothetical protein